MKRKSNHIDEYEYIKKKKTNHEVDKLNFEMSNIGLEQSTNNDDVNNNELSNIYDINFNDFNDIQNNIAEKINFLHENSENNTLTFDLIILISNNIINQIGKDKYIQGQMDDNLLGEKIFSEYISLLLYPTYLFQPYIFDDDLQTSYVNTRNNDLKTICIDSQCLFPTWKKKYNYDVDYTFNDNNKVHQQIYKKFIKKIFDFYEKIYCQYFNIMIGNILSFILMDYKINLNPYDNKFNKSVCLEWIDGFNKVLINCIKFIKYYAILMGLNKIDELDKDALVKKINKFNNSYVNILNGTNKNLKILFKPLEKFYKPYTNDDKIKLFVQTNCLINIKKEIDYIFKLKTYINMITNNTWVKKFSF